MNYESLKSYVKSICTSEFSEKLTINEIKAEKERLGVDNPIVAFTLKCTFFPSEPSIDVCFAFADGRQFLYFAKTFEPKDYLAIYQTLSRGEQLDLVQTIEEELVYQLDLYMVKPYIQDVQIFDDENHKIEHTEAIIKVKEI